MAHLLPVSRHLFLLLRTTRSNSACWAACCSCACIYCLPGLLLLLGQCSLLLSQQLLQGRRGLRHLRAAISSLVRFALRHDVSRFILPRRRSHSHSSISRSLGHTHSSTSEECCTHRCHQIVVIIHEIWFKNQNH